MNKYTYNYKDEYRTIERKHGRKKYSSRQTRVIITRSDGLIISSGWWPCDGSADAEASSKLRRHEFLETPEGVKAEKERLDAIREREEEKIRAEKERKENEINELREWFASMGFYR